MWPEDPRLRERWTSVRESLWFRLSLLLILAVLITGALQAALLTAAASNLLGRLSPDGRAVLSRALRAEVPGRARPIQRLFRPTFTTALLISTVVCLALAVLVARRFIRPLEGLSRAVRAVSGGELSVRVPEGNESGELRELAENFNHLAAQLQAAERERQFEAAAIAHELRTPITAMYARIDSLVDGLYPLTPAEVARLRAPLQMLEQLADDLRTLTLADARQLRLRVQPLRLGEELGELMEAWKLQSERADVSLHLAPWPDPEGQAVTVLADPLRWRQVMGNLLDNALRYAHSRTELTVSVGRPAPQTVTITVDDDGPGVPQAELPRLFDRFYQADEARAFQAARHGSGLGLPIARALAEAHGGSVDASTSRLGGLCLSVHWPIGGASSAAGLRPLPAEHAAQIAD